MPTINETLFSQAREYELQPRYFTNGLQFPSLPSLFHIVSLPCRIRVPRKIIPISSEGSRDRGRLYAIDDNGHEAQEDSDARHKGSTVFTVINRHRAWKPRYRGDGWPDIQKVALHLGLEAERKAFILESLDIKLRDVLRRRLIFQRAKSPSSQVIVN